MNRILLLVLISLTLATQLVAQSSDTALAGNWLGALDVGGRKLRLLLKVKITGQGYTAKFDSLDQGASDLPIETITLVDKRVIFTAPQFGMSFEGQLDEKSTEISGTFRQGGGSTPFVFTRVNEIPTVTKRQDPKKPYPYDEQEVSYRNTTDNVKLTGTLTIPHNGKAKHPVVLLISGSGSQNRDSMIDGHRPFLVLADYLTRNGIAVLRVDDRGTGGTDVGSLSVTTENFMYDVLAGVDFLKSRQEIDSGKIGLIGHSEGGMIAPMAAARSRDIAFIVLLAGLGQTGADVVETQTRLLESAAGRDEYTVSSAVTLAKTINAIVKAQTNEKLIDDAINAAIAKQTGAMTEAQRKAFAPVLAHFKSLMPIFKMNWYRYFITYDPATVLKKVQVPVLALNGELDLQVAWKENLDLIAAGLKAGNNRDVEVKAFPKLNHLFQTSKTGLISEYAKLEETMSPEVLETISQWISRRVFPDVKR